MVVESLIEACKRLDKYPLGYEDCEACPNYDHCMQMHFEAEISVNKHKKRLTD